MSFSPGARLLLDDGAIELIVETTTETDVVCRVINGGVLGERKGINLPGISLPIASLTEKDLEDLKWAVAQDVDYIALSFVRRGEDCRYAKRLINEAGGRAPLVAKVEMAEAITNLDEIVEAADGIMVARGDLGVETSVELVPVYQKRIIEKSVHAGKFVITATQMLQSMITSPRPTRAEASDVANAVWDGTDALMLSNETAVGQFPIPAVETMCRIIESAEESNEPETHSVSKWAGRQSGRVSRALCEAAAFAAEEMGIRVTAVLTESGLMARRLSALRPQTANHCTHHFWQRAKRTGTRLGRGISYHSQGHTTEEMLKAGEKTLLDAAVVEKGEMIVIMAGRLSGLGLSSSVTLFTVGEPLAPART